MNGHQVPSTLMPGLKSEIVGSLRAGRSLVQTAKEFDCSYPVAIELWMRDLERRVAAMARPVALTAMLLIGVSAAELWNATRGIEMQRAFRKGGRARKRGLEDGNQAIEYPVIVVAAA